MSERYRKCKACQGLGFKSDTVTQILCMSCNGTGFDGSADAFLQRQFDADWEREHLSYLQESERGYRQ